MLGNFCFDSAQNPKFRSQSGVLGQALNLDENFADFVAEPFGVKWFFHEGHDVGSQGEEVPHLPFGGEDDDGDAARIVFLLEARVNGIAVNLRHHDVQDHQIRLIDFNLLETFSPV